MLLIIINIKLNFLFKDSVGSSTITPTKKYIKINTNQNNLSCSIVERSPINLNIINSSVDCSLNKPCAPEPITPIKNTLLSNYL